MEGRGGEGGTGMEGKSLGVQGRRERGREKGRRVKI